MPKKLSVTQKAFNFVKRRPYSTTAEIAVAINKDPQYTAKLLYCMEQRDNVRVTHKVGRLNQYIIGDNDSFKRAPRKRTVTVSTSTQQGLALIQQGLKMLKLA